MQIELQLGGHVIQWLKEAKAELKGGTGTAKMAKLMRSARTLARGILPHDTVRSPLLPLAEGADVEIADALKAAGII